MIDPGDHAAQGSGVSHGGIAVGRSIRTGGSQAFTWTLDYGIIGLPNFAGRSYAVSNSANDAGVAWWGLLPIHFSEPTAYRSSGKVAPFRNCIGNVCGRVRFLSGRRLNIRFH